MFAKWPPPLVLPLGTPGALAALHARARCCALHRGRMRHGGTALAEGRCVHGVDDAPGVRTGHGKG